MLLRSSLTPPPPSIKPIKQIMRAKTEYIVSVEGLLDRIKDFFVHAIPRLALNSRIPDQKDWKFIRDIGSTLIRIFTDFLTTLKPTLDELDNLLPRHTELTTSLSEYQAAIYNVRKEGTQEAIEVEGVALRKFADCFERFNMAVNDTKHCSINIIKSSYLYLIHELGSVSTAITKFLEERVESQKTELENELETLIASLEGQTSEANE